MKVQGIRQQLTKRLHRRQLQAAQYGISAEPSIMVEAENLQRAIRQLDQLIHLRKVSVDQETMVGPEDGMAKELESLGIFVDIFDYTGVL